MGLFLIHTRLPSWCQSKGQEHDSIHMLVVFFFLTRPLPLRISGMTGTVEWWPNLCDVLCGLDLFSELEDVDLDLCFLKLPEEGSEKESD